MSGSTVDARLARLRGSAPPRRHNARTIAALTTNPGCSRRAVLDAAGIDKQGLASQVNAPAPFGQSPFAITRGNAFEAQVKADGCAALLALLAETLGLTGLAAPYTDLSTVHPAGPGGHGAAGGEPNEARHARSRELLAGSAAALLDHPLLRLDVGGERVYLEPDLVTLRTGGRYHVVEIKSFPVIDGQADPAKVAAAATQAAVYVLALRDLLAELGADPADVADEVVLVCPRDFANQPVAALVDVRRQVAVLRRQLARMARIRDVLDALPTGLTFDLDTAPDGTPTRPPEQVAAALGAVDARYAPECLAACELSYFCRAEARGGTAALGRAVREQLGGVERIETVLALAAGQPPAPDQAEAAGLLRAAARLRAEALGAG